jgi:hypothetical protein
MTFERQRDCNPPEQRAAQRTLLVCRHNSGSEASEDTMLGDSPCQRDKT